MEVHIEIIHVPLAGYIETNQRYIDRHNKKRIIRVVDIQPLADHKFSIEYNNDDNRSYFIEARNFLKKYVKQERKQGDTVI
jgi:endonuclease YncB( thermonuclease family)